MSELKLFENPSFGSVRVVTINDDPWFVARDVCDCLAIANSRDAVAQLYDDEKQVLLGEQFSETQSSCDVGITDVAQNAGLPDLPELANNPKGLSVISESGFYSLVMRSRKPEAQEFRRWVTHEILPSIRKTGMYAMPKDLPSALRAYADAIEREKAERAEKEKAQAALSQEQSAHLDTQYDLSVARHELIELNDRYSEFTAQGSVNDMRSAYDMQAVLLKYFDTGKRRGDKGFWWYMSGFMHTYCHGGIRNNSYSAPGLNCTLPGELTGHVYQIAKRDNTTVFDRRAWADVTAYFKSHKDSLKDLPYIGYAAR